MKGAIEVTRLLNWTHLQDLTLIVSGTSCISSKMVPISLPQHLIRLSIKTFSKIKLRLHIPASVIHVRLEATCPVFDVSTEYPGAQLQTLRITGNVFANVIEFPASLQLFHIRLSKAVSLDQKWDALSNRVDFQVLYE